MPISDAVEFSAVVMIESLGPKDEPTGSKLFESHLTPLAKKHHPFSVDYVRATSAASFLDALAGVCNAARRDGVQPILHFETHGNERGLQLANGDELAWEDLREPLTTLNIASRMNLLVVMALCSGAHMARTLNPTKPAPAWGIVGPHASLSAEAVREATSAFYSILFAQLDVYKALSAANNYAERANWLFRLESAEVMLFRTYRKVLQKHSTPEALAIHEDELVTHIVQRHLLDADAGGQVRLTVRQMLADHESHFMHFRESFLMLDRFPENAERFKLTFAECQEWAARAA